MNTLTHSAAIRQACFVFFSIILFSSCNKDYIKGSGNVITEKRSSNNFTDVEIYGPFEVQLIPDSIPGIEISAEDNIISTIETGVKDNSLYVRLQSSVNLRTHLPIKVYVHNPTFQRTKFNGSGILTNKDTLRTALFKYEVNGSALADLVLNVDNLFITVNGSGATNLSGSSRNLNGTINGSGDVNAWNLPAPVADITINGSGAFRVLVSEQLTARIHGSGNIHFKGDADLIADIKGSGQIIR